VGFPLALPQTTEEITEARSLTTGLESCGLAAADTTAVLKELAAGRSLDELSREIATGSLLRKRSRTGRQHLLTAIRKRYLKPMAPLPDTLVLAAGLERIKAPTAQGQLLLPYLLSADRAAYEVVVGRVLPRRAAGERITTTEIVDELDRVFARFGKGSWGPRVRLRWSQGILSVLRDVGAVGRGVTSEGFVRFWDPRVCSHRFAVLADVAAERAGRATGSPGSGRTGLVAAHERWRRRRDVAIVEIHQRLDHE
jgi:hypothetical protein